MRAMVFDGKLTCVDDYAVPSLSGDQALLRIRRAGICNTDLELVKGYMNYRGILGHEFVAEVVDGPAEWLGKRVVGEINVADGTCDLCARGIPSQCRGRTTVGMDRHPGAFADYLALTARNLHVVPDEVSDDAATFVEPLAAALQVTELTPITPSSRVIVIGAGKLGLLIAQVLKLTGADLAVVVRRDRPRSLLDQWGIPAVTLEELPAEHAQIVVDVTGSAEGFESALQLVEPRGTIVLKSTYVGLPQADLTRVVVKEVNVVGSRCGPFDAALRLLGQGLIDTQSMIDARYSIEDGLEAMEHSARPGALKVLLTF
jgi:alcohol dehydrogenase